MKNTGKEFEKAVYEIISMFSDDAVVRKDVELVGKSRTKRQIDVLVESKVLGIPVSMVVECKDYRGKIGIGVVDELLGKLDDVGANIGVLVSNSGFTKNAIFRAKYLGNIQLYTLLDSENRKIRTKLFLPVKVTYVTLKEGLNAEFRVTGVGLTDESKKNLFLHNVLKSEGIAILMEFAKTMNKEARELDAGVAYYEGDVFNSEEGNVFMQVRFDVEKSTYVNENIYLPFRGLLDVVDSTITKGQFGLTHIVEGDVINQWKKVKFDYQQNPKGDHLIRCFCFGESWARSTLANLLEDLNAKCCKFT